MNDQIMESLKTKNNDELRNICRDKKLKGFSKCKKKQDLIDFIIESGVLNIVDEEIVEEIVEEEIRQEEEIIDQTFVDITIGKKTYQMDMDNIIFHEGEQFAKIIFSDNDTAYFILDRSIHNISNFVLKRFGVNHYITIGYVNKCVPRNKITFDVDFYIPPVLFQEYSKALEKYNSMFDIKYIPHQNPHLYENYEIYLRQNDIVVDNLRILYHGTDENNIQSILDRGFSLATGVRHGEAHGSGIYFSDDLEFVLRYADKSRYSRYRSNDQNIASSNKAFVIVSEVYVENIIEGRTNRHLLPNLPNSTKLYDTAVDNVTNPKQFIKKDAKDGINILGYFELTFKDEYLKNKESRYNSYTNINTNTRNFNRPKCSVVNCPEHSTSKTELCKKCWIIANQMPPSINSVKIKLLSDKNTEWNKKRFGDTSKYKIYRHECPKCNHKETMIIRTCIMNCSSTPETKDKLRELLLAKEKCRNICICNELSILASQCKKDIDKSRFKTISLKNETPYEIAIYYKPRHFNIYTDDITKCKKMTDKGLIKPNEEFKVHTKHDDEFIVGYFVDNELNVMKIISVDIHQEKNIIRM